MTNRAHLRVIDGGAGGEDWVDAWTDALAWINDHGADPTIIDWARAILGPQPERVMAEEGSDRHTLVLIVKAAYADALEELDGNDDEQEARRLRARAEQVVAGLVGS